MAQSENAALHDAYASTYDTDVQACDCNVAELLFGLCYEATSPGQRLLDVGIGSGLSSQLFAKAGLQVHGMDFSPVMLEICRAKGFATDLRLHDVQAFPWPYPSTSFDHLVCCGVLHFISDLEGIFGEAARVLVDGGVLAFTTRSAAAPLAPQQEYERQVTGEFEIFSHARAYVESLLAEHSFAREKTQRCFVGEDQFLLWVARRNQRTYR